MPVPLCSTFITGPPTRCVGARLVMVAGVCRRCRLSSSSVTLPAGAQAVGRPTLHGRPVVLRTSQLGRHLVYPGFIATIQLGHWIQNVNVSGQCHICHSAQCLCWCVLFSACQRWMMKYRGYDRRGFFIQMALFDRLSTTMLKETKFFRYVLIDVI